MAAENLTLRKQLALFQEREIRPRRVDDATRAALVWLSRAFSWGEALVVVKPAMLIREITGTIGGSDLTSLLVDRGIFFINIPTTDSQRRIDATFPVPPAFN